MNKAEAIEALMNGAKLTHRFFYDDEFIYMERSLIHDEKGYILHPFWAHRTEKDWESDWSIWQEKQTASESNDDLPF